MIQSLGFPLEFASKEMKKEGRKGRHVGVGMEEGGNESGTTFIIL